MEDQKTKPKRFWKVLAISLAGLGVACLAGAGLLFFINSRLPVASANPAALSSEQKALMAEGIHLRETLGDKLWPGFGDASIPLLTYSETTAFLCGYANPPAGWTIIKPSGGAEPACYQQAWPNGQSFTYQVGDQWVGTMVTREWGLIDLRHVLREEMPPVVGTLIGPLMVNEMLKPQRYLGGLVHESFHAYEATVARAAFDDANEANSSSGSYWKLDPVATGEWTAEINALSQAVNSKDDTNARKYASQFLMLRDDRRNAHFSGQPALVLYEERYEWLEGLAKYIELGVQQQACDDPSYASLEAMKQVPGFSGYCGINSLWQQEMDQMKRQANQPGDVRFYYTGWAQALLLDRFQPGWKARAFAGEHLDELLRDALKGS